MNPPPSAVLAARYPALADACGADLDDAFGRLVAAFAAGHRLLLCGNGGSAADCDHIAAELMKGFLRPRPLPGAAVATLRRIGGERGDRLGRLLQGALPAVSLTGPAALVSAVGNDTAADLAFAQQVYGLGTPGDVLLGISTSGNAENVCNAFVVARLRGLTTVALTGRGGGQLAALADVAVRVPAGDTPTVQELHLPVYHALCIALEAYFFPDDAGGHSPT